MPESPRWLEARERRDAARQVMERMETRVSKNGQRALPEPDLGPYEVVAEEKTSWLAPFGKDYVVATVLLLVVMALGYGGIVYCGSGQLTLFLILDRGWSAGTVFAFTAWPGVVASAAYLVNAFFGDRFERKYTQLLGAVLFAGGYWGVYQTHSKAAVATFFIIAVTGTVLWLWSMYVYIRTTTRPGCGRWAPAGPTASATSAPGAACSSPGSCSPRPRRADFFVFVTIPCAIVPGLLIGIFGKRQRRRALEELAR